MDRANSKQKVSGSSTPSPVRRGYDSSRRQAEARERRKRVIDAATRLFLEQGYGATSIDQIASEAQVSAPTVYAAFESKAGILARAVEVALVGDDEPVPVSDRPNAREVHGEADLPTRLRLAAHYARIAYERAAPLFALVDSSSGSDESLATLRAQFAAGLKQDSHALAATIPKRALRRGLSPEDARDTVAVLIAAGTWTRLTVELGWTADRAERWLADALALLLLRDPA